MENIIIVSMLLISFPFGRITVADEPARDLVPTGKTAQQPWGSATGPRYDTACELIVNIVGGTQIPGWSDNPKK